jgi:purine-nucleoside phosphorylase
MFVYEDYQESADFIREKISIKPKIAVVLGSGLGSLTEKIEALFEIPYRDIPHFPVSTAPGHAGKMIFGTLAGQDVIFMSGRFHYYEGYSMQEISYYVRVLSLLGVKTMIMTNAAGGVNRAFAPGDFMLISDHIKLFDDSPLRGGNIDEFGVRFPDMTEVYTKELIQLAKQAVDGFVPKEGVYAFMPGPMYETPAEIRMLETLGADAVGMSTVPEAITAAHCQMRVLAISCITNMAAGILGEPLSSDEVLQASKAIEHKLSQWIKIIIKTIGEAS